MAHSFRPASSFTERKGCFVALTGGTNSGKTYSGLELAVGLSGDKRVAVLDTEGGRTLHLKKHFDFDAQIMSAPYHPASFAKAAEDAEREEYGCLLIDSFSQEWAGLGGVLNWHETSLEEMVQRALSRKYEKREDWQLRDAMKMAAWIKPKMAHKAMVLSFLNRRIPIIFSIRGEESTKPAEQGGKPINIFKSICDKQFPYELTVSFRLAQDKKGFIDLSDPKSWKMEGDHQAIFRNGDRITRQHGVRLAAWARGDVDALALPAQEQTQISVQKQIASPSEKQKPSDLDFVNTIIAELENAPNRKALEAIVDRTASQVEALPADLKKMAITAYNAAVHGFNIRGSVNEGQPA